MVADFEAAGRGGSVVGGEEGAALTCPDHGWSFRRQVPHRVP
jgi:hypothetical protein